MPIYGYCLVSTWKFLVCKHSVLSTPVARTIWSNLENRGIHLRRRFIIDTMVEPLFDLRMLQ